MKVGIDIGNVLTTKDTDNPSAAFSNDPYQYLNAPQMEGAYDSVRELVEMFGTENVYLVSKCGKKMQEKSAKWLKYQRFYEITGVQEENVFFCFKRHEKTPICEQLGINVFIDDRYTVLEHMVGLEQMKALLLFKPNEKEYNIFLDDRKTNNIILVKNWSQVMDFIGKLQ